jgi:hypothetical protein
MYPSQQCLVRRQLPVVSIPPHPRNPAQTVVYCSARLTSRARCVKRQTRGPCSLPIVFALFEKVLANTPYPSAWSFIMLLS